jgi:hypothetical protein
MWKKMVWYLWKQPIVSVAGVALPIENVPYGIVQAQGTVQGLLLRRRPRRELVTTLNSFAAAVVDSGLEVAHPDVPCRSINDSDTNCKGIKVEHYEPWYVLQNNGYHGTHVLVLLVRLRK